MLWFASFRAQVVNSPDLPPDHVLAADFAGQYVQIITLTPSSEAERDAAVAAFAAASAPTDEAPAPSLAKSASASASAASEADALALADEDANMPMRVRRYRQNNVVRVFSFSRVYKDRDAGKSDEAESTWYHRKIESIEDDGSVFEGWKGVLEKGKWWKENFTVLSMHAKGPYVCSTGFAVVYSGRVRMTDGTEVDSQECGVYTVEKGRIVREQFMRAMF